MLMRKQNTKIWITSLTAFFLSLPLIPSTDAVAARSDFSKDPNNWFGSLTPFVYGVAPWNDATWFYVVSVIQVVLFSLGLSQLFKRREAPNFGLLPLTFFGASFASWVIRDSLLFSLLVFSLGLIVRNLEASRRREILFLTIGFVTLLISLSIRPYLSICFLFFFLFASRALRVKTKTTAIFLLVLVSAPFLIDSALSKGLDQSDVYPLQQVVIFDLAQMACWSSNTELRLQATEVLNPISRSSSVNELCQNLKPYNWQFAVSGEDTDKSGPLKRLTRDDAVPFYELVRGYLRLAIQRPDEILKIKLRNMNELLFVNGQFDGLENSKSLNSGLFKILDKLHLFSWILVIPACIVYSLKFKIFGKLSRLNLKYNFAFVAVGSGLLMLPMISIFYVGAIGRYTFIPTFLMALGLTISEKSKTTI
jgi:hypothetical protein